MVEVLEELELDRLRESLGRLDAIDHHPARPSDKPRVEIRGGRAEHAREVGLPRVPVVRFEVAARDATAGAGEGMEVVAGVAGEVPDLVEVQRAVERGRL